MSTISKLDRELLGEMPMVDIVYTLLTEGEEPQSFHDLLKEVAQLKGFSEKQKLQHMSQLYTEINIDGRFTAMGDNRWALKKWYPVEQAEEVVITDLKKKPKKRKKSKKEDTDDFLEDDYDDLEAELDDFDDESDDLEEDLDDDVDEDLDEDDDFDDDEVEDDLGENLESDEEDLDEEEEEK